MAPPDTSFTDPPADFDWMTSLYKAVLTGGIAAVASYVLSGDATQSIDVYGMSVPAMVVLGAGGAAGSLSADLVHQYVFPMIPHNQKYDKAEAAALSVVSSGLGFYLASGLVLGDKQISLLPGLAIGAGSYVASDYTWSHFIATSSGGLLY